MTLASCLLSPQTNRGRCCTGPPPGASGAQAPQGRAGSGPRRNCCKQTSSSQKSLFFSFLFLPHHEKPGESFPACSSTNRRQYTRLPSSPTRSPQLHLQKVIAEDVRSRGLCEDVKRQTSGVVRCAATDGEAGWSRVEVGEGPMSCYHQSFKAYPGYKGYPGVD